MTKFHTLIALSAVGLFGNPSVCSSFMPSPPSFYYVDYSTMKMNSVQQDNMPDDESSNNRNHNKNSNTQDEECPLLFDYDHELTIDSDLPVTDIRRARKQRERLGRVRFASGDNLMQLRENLVTMYDQLRLARETNYEVRISALTEAIASAERKDPDLVYARALGECADAELSGDFDAAAELWSEAKLARDNISQYNLHGLWVGKYGSSGYQMINITYVGDTLIATKLTGDKNVPKGEVTFIADLSPTVKAKDGSKKGGKGYSNNNASSLEPITLSESAAKKWGTAKLNRFHGKGQIASEKFTDTQFVEGQLIMVGDYFSFAWVPIGHQIFFGRPSLELTLKMLKDGNNRNDGMDNMRSLIARCFDESDELEKLDHQQIDWDGYNNNNNSNDPMESDFGGMGAFE